MSDLKERIQNLSAEQRARLEQQLLERRRPAPAHIHPVGGHGPFPLSFAQQRMWFLHALNPEQALYNMPLGMRFRGNLDVRALERSVNEVVRRHDVLRTRFQTAADTPEQVITPYSPFPLRHVRLDTPRPSIEQELQEATHKAALTPFDLANGPVFRADLFRVDPGDHVLLLTIHHIAADGWSLDIIAKEIEGLYRAFHEDKPSPLPDLRIQYADFSKWQTEWLQTEGLAQQVAYWKTQLDGIQPLNLLPDRPRPIAPGHRAGRATLRFKDGAALSLRQFARERGVTPYMALLCTFQALLHRHTGQTDIVTGSPIASRRNMEIEDHVGNFVNTVALRGDLSGEPTFSEFLERTRKTVIGALDHQDVPFEKLVQELQPERTPSRTPVFQAMFAMDGEEQEPPQLPGIGTEWYRIRTGWTRFEVSLTISESGEELRGVLDYDRDLFDDVRMDFMARQFVLLLEAMEANPDRNISRIPLLGEEEIRLMVSEWNETATDPVRGETVIGLFEEEVRRWPNAAAIRDGDRSITYASLHEKSSRLAGRLVSAGVLAEHRVGICLERSIEAIISVIAVLKAGGAYVPLAPDLPEERLRYMLDDAGIRVVLWSGAGTRPNFDDGRTLVLAAGESGKADDPETEFRPNFTATARNIAYVIYTSGSTGKPKGVAVEHRSLLNYLQWVNRTLTPGSRFSIPWLTKLSFDASLKQTLAVLLRGGCVAVIGENAEPADLVNGLKSGAWSGINCVPSLWRVILEGLGEHTIAGEAMKGFCLFLGGEGFTDQLIAHTRHLLPQAAIWNLYGPTEATANATAGVIAANQTPHIGKPLANGRAYVLGPAGLPQPMGASGDLFVGGVPVARGYLGRPELTAERFVPDPWGPPGSVLYRTGDLARHLSDGNLQFLGRSDQQVKVRGFRVEPGEVESALTECEGIREALVVPFGSSEETQLRAYVVPEGNTVVDLGRLRQALALKLPDYMIPLSITILEEMPLNHSGKIDRNALPAPQVRTEAAPGYTPARNPVEQHLVDIWEKLLNREPIGVRDNFFDLGGHSLLAVSLFQRIERTYGRHLPLATLFQAPTIELLAGFIRDAGWEPSWSSLVCLQPEGKLPPFFCFHAVGGNVLNYTDLANRLGTEQPFWGVQAVGLDRTSDPHTRVEDMAAHYIREIQCLQPKGPYYLGGASSGGLIAFEVARQLHAAGERVGILALFDTYAPGYPRQIPGATRFRKFVNYQRERVSQHLDGIWGSPGRAKLEYIARKSKKLKYMLEQRVRWKIKRIRGLAPERNAPYHPDFKHVNLALIHAFKTYKAGPYPGTVTIFRATSQPLDCYFDPDLGWKDLVGSWKAIEIKGHHGAIILDPRAGTLAAALRGVLQEAREATPGPHHRS